MTPSRAFIASAFAAQAEVRFGILNEAYPPFFAKDASGTWKGWEIEVGTEVCKRAELECEFVATAWDGIIPALTENKFDAIIASMSITEERKAKIAPFRTRPFRERLR